MGYDRKKFIADLKSQMNQFNNILNRMMIPKYDFIEKIVVCHNAVRLGKISATYHIKKDKKLTLSESVTIIFETSTLYKMTGFNYNQYSGPRFVHPKNYIWYGE